MDIPKVNSYYRERREILRTFKITEQFWRQNYCFEELIEGIKLIEIKSFKDNLIIFFDKGKNAENHWTSESFFYWFEEFTPLKQEEFEV